MKNASKNTFGIRGATLVDHAMLVAVVSLLSIGGIRGIGGATWNSYDRSNVKLQEAFLDIGGSSSTTEDNTVGEKICEKISNIEQKKVCLAGMGDGPSGNNGSSGSSGGSGNGGSPGKGKKK